MDVTRDEKRDADDAPAAVQAGIARCICHGTRARRADVTVSGLATFERKQD